MKKYQKRRAKKRWDLFSLIALPLIIVIIGAAIWFSTRTSVEISFEAAAKKLDLREKYIEKVVKEIGKPTEIREIIYATPEKIEYLKKEWNYKGGEKILMAILKNEEVVPGELRKNLLRK